MQADWITAISTFLMMIATFAIAIIAWQAKNTWKEELKQRKLHDLTREYFDILKDIECIIKYKHTYNDLNVFEKIWKNYQKLGTLNSELILVDKENQFKKVNDKIFNLLGDYTKNYSLTHQNILLCNNSKDFMKDEEVKSKMLSYLSQAKEICVKQLQKFHN